MRRTRAIWLANDLVRQQADNRNTLVAPMWPSPRDPSLEQGFVRHYQPIRWFTQACDQPGLAIVVIDELGLAATGFLAAKRATINTAIVGRHSHADVYLGRDVGLSLRHLMLITHPYDRGRDVRFRLVDLRTATAFEDEQGRRVQALEAEGPVFIRCSRYALYIFPTTTLLPWPDDPKDGWACVPDRVYFDDVLAEPDRWQRRRLRLAARARVPWPARAGARPTLVQFLPGPTFACRSMVGDGEEPLGQLQILGAAAMGTIVVGPAAAREGVLLGREYRCDHGGRALLSNQAISRVHLLVIEIGGVLYAADTASTSGLSANGQSLRALPLSYGSELVLGSDLAHVRYVALH